MVDFYRIAWLTEDSRELVGYTYFRTPDAVKSFVSAALIAVKKSNNPDLLNPMPLSARPIMAEGGMVVANLINIEETDIVGASIISRVQLPRGKSGLPDEFIVTPRDRQEIWDAARAQNNPSAEVIHLPIKLPSAPVSSANNVVALRPLQTKTVRPSQHGCAKN